MTSDPAATVSSWERFVAVRDSFAGYGIHTWPAVDRDPLTDTPTYAVVLSLGQAERVLGLMSIPAPPGPILASEDPR